jgi:hypothetical protein
LRIGIPSSVATVLGTVNADRLQLHLKLPDFVTLHLANVDRFNHDSFLHSVSRIAPSFQLYHLNPVVDRWSLGNLHLGGVRFDRFAPLRPYDFPIIVPRLVGQFDGEMRTVLLGFHSRRIGICPLCIPAVDLSSFVCSRDFHVLLPRLALIIRDASCALSRSAEPGSGLRGSCELFSSLSRTRIERSGDEAIPALDVSLWVLAHL